MRSLISILWQLEVQNFRIFSTVLKNHKQNPHHYFYSEKQRRILRKKTPNIVSLIEESQSGKDAKKMGILHIKRNQRERYLSLQFTQIIQCLSCLNQPQFQGQFIIIPRNFQLVKCKLDSKFSIQLMTNQRQSQQIKQKLFKYVSNLNIDIVNQIQKKLKELKTSSIEKQTKFHKPNQVTNIDIILAYRFDENSTDCEIFLVDAIELKFLITNYNIVQINYKPEPNAKIILSSNVIQKKKQAKTEKIQSLMKKEQQKHQINSKQSEVKGNSKCSACECQIQQNTCKQVSNQDLKLIRKLKSRSIRGFNEEYYEVCMDCYELL